MSHTVFGRNPFRNVLNESSHHDLIDKYWEAITQHRKKLNTDPSAARIHREKALAFARRFERMTNGGKIYDASHDDEEHQPYITSDREEAHPANFRMSESLSPSQKIRKAFYDRIRDSHHVDGLSVEQIAKEHQLSPKIIAQIISNKRSHLNESLRTRGLFQPKIRRGTPAKRREEIVRARREIAAKNVSGKRWKIYKDAERAHGDRQKELDNIHHVLVMHPEIGPSDQRTRDALAAAQKHREESGIGPGVRRWLKMRKISTKG